MQRREMIQYHLKNALLEGNSTCFARIIFRFSRQNPFPCFYILTRVNLKVNFMYKDHLHLLYCGQRYDLFEIVDNGRQLVGDFIENLPAADQKKILALLKRSADHGPPANIEKFRHLRNGLYEFKTFGVRIFCLLQKGRIIILTHGALKKRQKGDPDEYEKAFRLLEKHGIERK